MSSAGRSSHKLRRGGRLSLARFPPLVAYLKRGYKLAPVERSPLPVGRPRRFKVGRYDLFFEVVESHPALLRVPPPRLRRASLSGSRSGLHSLSS